MQNKRPGSFLRPRFKQYHCGEVGVGVVWSFSSLVMGLRVKLQVAGFESPLISCLTCSICYLPVVLFPPVLNESLIESTSLGYFEDQMIQYTGNT